MTDQIASELDRLSDDQRQHPILYALLLLLALALTAPLVCIALALAVVVVR